MKDIGTLILLGGLAIGAIIFWPKIKEFTQGLGNGGGNGVSPSQLTAEQQRQTYGITDAEARNILDRKVAESRAKYGNFSRKAPGT